MEDFLVNINVLTQIHHCLFRQGKSKPLSIIEKDLTGCYVNLFTDFGDLNRDVDQHVVSEFVCRIYAATNTRDINEARYQKLVKMTGKVDQVITEKNYFCYREVDN